MSNPTPTPAKVALIGNGESSAELLRQFSKMTPRRSNRWKNVLGVGSPDDADYCAVIDRLPPHLASRIPEGKCIFLGAHPETTQHYAKVRGRGFFSYDQKYEFGFGEWWLRYDYDYLAALAVPHKTASLGAIISNSNSAPDHKRRRAYLERLCQRHPELVEIYGRIKPTGSLVSCYRGVLGQQAASGSDYWSGKEPIYERYRYMLEFDCRGSNYFSERVFDCLLLWALPFYWGGDGVKKYLPEGSYRLLDIGGAGDDVKAWADDPGLYERSIPAMREARELLLNKYQIWPRIHEAIFGVP